MATDRPEFFYHPVVGVIAPASFGLFRLNTGAEPPARASPPPPPPSLSMPPAPTTPPLVVAPAAVQTHQQANVMTAAPTRKERPYPMPRRPQILSRTQICAVSGEVCSVNEMIRFAIAPDLTVIPDLAEKLPGQPIYIKADRRVLKKAIWRNVFTTLARAPVKVPGDFLEIIESGLSRQALDTINLARRAGEVVMGFMAVDEKLRVSSGGIYVVASDASDQGRARLEKKLRSGPVLDLWTCNELSIALGEANTNHLFVEAGSLAEKLLRIAKKLKAVRSDV